MRFAPNAHDQIALLGHRYKVAPHPSASASAPIPFSAEGRKGVVFCLEDERANRHALKVFKPAYRRPAVVASSERLNPLSSIRGLRAAQRAVIAPSMKEATEIPDLKFAVVMPWISGVTWFDVLVAAQTRQQSLKMTESMRICDELLQVVSELEARGLAHTDVAPGNVVVDVGRACAELVDLEDMFIPGVSPDVPSSHSGSNGYRHVAEAPVQGPYGDRYAVAVMAAEMLVLSNASLARNATDEGFFVGHIGSEIGRTRYREAQPWLDSIAPDFARLFAGAWNADSLGSCPPVSELLTALRKASSAAAVPGQGPILSTKWTELGGHDRDESDADTAGTKAPRKTRANGDGAVSTGTPSAADGSDLVVWVPYEGSETPTGASEPKAVAPNRWKGLLLLALLIGTILLLLSPAGAELLRLMGVR